MKKCLTVKLNYCASFYIFLCEYTYCYIIIFIINKNFEYSLLLFYVQLYNTFLLKLQITFLKKLLTVFYGYNLGAPDGCFVTRPKTSYYVQQF